MSHALPRPYITLSEYRRLPTLNFFLCLSFARPTWLTIALPPHMPLEEIGYGNQIQSRSFVNSFNLQIENIFIVFSVAPNPFADKDSILGENRCWCPIWNYVEPFDLRFVWEAITVRTVNIGRIVGDLHRQLAPPTTCNPLLPRWNKSRATIKKLSNTSIDGCNSGVDTFAVD